MAYDFSALHKELDETKNWLRGELSIIHTGRATSAILDSVRVDSYGSLVPLNQVANIVTEDAHTIRVVPWSPNQINAIETGINNANLGLSINSDNKGIRVIFPDLTSETRSNLLKIVKDKLEQARVAVKGERNKSWEEIQGKEKSGEISEDDMHRFKGDMQSLVDEANKELEEMYKKKEIEIEI